MKVRDSQVVNRPIYVALAVTADGTRDILGLWAGDGGEGAKYWLQVLTEQVFADLEDSALGHLPSGKCTANAAWLTLAAVAHNLTRALGTLASAFHARARTGTIRRALTFRRSGGRGGHARQRRRGRQNGVDRGRRLGGG